MEKFEFFKDMCGFNNIVSIPTMVTDLMLYYNINTTMNAITKIYDNYQAYYDFLWSKLKEFKPIIPSTTIQSIKKINGDDNVYQNVIRIDFEKALLNYMILDESIDIKRYINRFFIELERYPFPPNLKKYLYIYTVTNIATKKFGSSYIVNIQNKIYDDIQKNFLSLGYVIKSEIDGIYIQSDLKDFKPKLPCIGRYHVYRYKWLIKHKSQMIFKDLNDKVTIKGISKDSPNIFRTMLKSIATMNMADQEKYLDKLCLVGPNNILDYAYKSSDGMSIKLFIPGMVLNVDNITSDKLKDLRSIKEVDISQYINEISPLINKVFALRGW